MDPSFWQLVKTLCAERQMDKKVMRRTPASGAYGTNSDKNDKYGKKGCRFTNGSLFSVSGSLV